jgi:Putative auto-transporter adhesin, head GIN domain
MHEPAPRRAHVHLALLGVVAILAVGGCGPSPSPTPVPAASDSRTESRSLAAFTAVSVDGPLNLVLGTGTADSVDVQAPSNLLSLVQTTVSDNQLDVAVAPPGFTSAKPVTVRITSSRVASISLRGGATGTIEAMGASLTLSLSGGSTIRGIGTVAQLTVTVLGSSTAELGDLAADTGVISAAGGAKATLRVAKQLTGTIDSGAIVTLAVAPDTKSVAVTGGAQLILP